MELPESVTDYLPAKLVLYLIIVIGIWFLPGAIGYKSDNPTGYNIMRVILTVLLAPITHFIVQNIGDRG